MTKFDPTKPVQTRDGRSARIICTDRVGGAPIVALVKIGLNEEANYGYRSDGVRYSKNGDRSDDLVNIPQRHKHADVIIAWANGAQVQYRADASMAWEDTESPKFLNNLEYRVKPECGC
jgi:hypothetical protein